MPLRVPTFYGTLMAGINLLRLVFLSMEQWTAFLGAFYSWKSSQLTRTRESLLRTTSILSNNLEVYREGYVVIKAQRM